MHIIFDNNNKSQKIRNSLIKKIKSQKFSQNNLVIVIGGDGFIASNFKKKQRLK